MSVAVHEHIRKQSQEKTWDYAKRLRCIMDALEANEPSIEVLPGVMMRPGMIRVSVETSKQNFVAKYGVTATQAAKMTHAEFQVKVSAKQKADDAKRTEMRDKPNTVQIADSANRSMRSVPGLHSKMRL